MATEPVIETALETKLKEALTQELAQPVEVWTENSNLVQAEVSLQEIESLTSRVIRRLEL